METPAIDKIITLVREKAPRLEILWPSLASAAALGDICLWRNDPQFSIGLFGLGLMGLILLNRPAMRWTRTTAILVVLTCGAAVEAAIDLCFSNVLVMLALILAVSGETYYDSLRSGWSRWSEAIWTMAKTPGRWCALLLNMGMRLREDGTPDAKGLKRAARAVWIVLPGLAATFVFALIFANGNALFAHLTGDWATSIYNWITHFDLSPWRIFFWGFVITLTLPLLWPSPSPKNMRVWAKEPPRLPDRGTGNTARLQSGIMLGLLNALFFFVNTLDAVYLWAGQKLPQGVDPKSFVHEGTASIIVAVIFSAILITGIFHQSDRVAKWTPIRLMGMMWIAQNLVLLGGVFLRTKLYIDGFDLTVTRVHLILFFVLVTLGFLLLGIHVWKQKPLGWLMHANMMTTFALFYFVQFFDTAGFVARYEVNRWEKTKGQHVLNFAYLGLLGPPAYESLIKVANEGGSDASGEPVKFLKNERALAQGRLDKMGWAGLQLRDASCERKLLAARGPQ